MTLTTKALLAITAVSIALAAVFGGTGGRTIRPKTDRDMARTTAMITRMDGRSGGTGVVVSSGPHESKVLTNAHVCGVAKNGGLVTTDSKRAVVASYQISNFHDLCLITVKSDLGVNAALTEYAPEVYGAAAVAGHPSLMPSIITRGHFSQKEVVTVLTGFKPCTAEDLETDNAILCIFLGGIPILRTYEAQVVSATILPGSSGSAVYNQAGEISGLVFAGAAGLSYGLIVPAEYVYNFLTNEIKTLESKFPMTEQVLSANEAQMKAKLRAACLRFAMGEEAYSPVSRFCSASLDDLIYTQ